MESWAKVSTFTTPQFSLKLPHIFNPESRQVSLPLPQHTQNFAVLCQADLWGWRAGCSCHEPGVLTIGCSTDKWVLSETTQPWTTFFSYICQSNWRAGAALKRQGPPHPCLVTYGVLKNTQITTKLKLIKYSQHRRNYCTELSPQIIN